MTIRERIEQALHCRPVDRVPFTCYEGLLPPGGADIEGLGLIGVASPYTVSQPDAEWSSETLPDGMQVTTLRTPVGTLTKRARQEPGYGSWWTIEHLVKRPDDYAVVAWLMETAVIEPRPDLCAGARDELGERGVMMASLPRAPLQQLWIEYAGVERMSFDLHDCRDAVLHVVGAMAEKSRRIARLLAESEAEFIWLPDNVTGEIVGPRLFEEIMAPYYEEMAAILHPAGKRLVCHMDGMMKRLKESVAATPLDIIEAFTPPPDADLPLDEARAAWPGKAVWINFPSSVHLADPEVIRQVARDLVRQGTQAPGFLISVTENIPASVGTRSLEAIASAL